MRRRGGETASRRIGESESADTPIRRFPVSLCEDCGVPARWSGKPGQPCLCAFDAGRRRTVHRRAIESARRRSVRALPKLSGLNVERTERNVSGRVTRKNLAVMQWWEIGFLLGVDACYAQRALRRALHRIKTSGCDVAALLEMNSQCDHNWLSSHATLVKSTGYAARMAIEAWQMQADIIAPEAPIEAAAIRREVERFKRAIK